MTKATDMMAAYFKERQEDQQAAKERQAQFIQSAKKSPLAAVNYFMAVKNDGAKGMGLTEDAKAFYADLTQADMNSYLEAAEKENMHIIQLTADERFIHQKAADSYDGAMKKQQELAEAYKQLANFTQKIKVTLFDGTPVAEVAEKPDEKSSFKSNLTITITGEE